MTSSSCIALLAFLFLVVAGVVAIRVRRSHAKLRQDLASARVELDRLLGPHCTGCGNPIDPDCCGCGVGVDNHASVQIDDHTFVSAGCDCLCAEQDWPRIAAALRRRLHVVTAQRDLVVVERDELFAERGICHDAGKFIDGALSDERAEAFRRHVGACQRCQVEVHGAMQLETVADRGVVP